MVVVSVQDFKTNKIKTCMLPLIVRRIVKPTMYPQIDKKYS